ncbi:acyclic terpene utilization AtuA family protein, partial [Rhizobiaceae sp. 2RAB30]
AECRADGSFELTKPADTGGLVSPMTVGEQIVYEVGDPAAYVLPDVTCDWTAVKLEQTGKDRVRVSGAKGRAPTDSFKVSATYADGYRAAVTMMIVGHDAVEKAETVGKAILARSTRLMKEAGMPGFSETSVEVLGGEASYGESSRAGASREVVLKIAVRHPNKEALQIFGREIYPAATAMAQGLTGFAGGRPEPQPVVRLFSFLAQKDGVPVEVEIDGNVIPVKTSLAHTAVSSSPGEHPASSQSSTPSDGLGEQKVATIPLIALAHGRSGDKGDIANIGVLARRPEFLPVLRQVLTPETVRTYLAHFAKGEVERFEWPGLDGFNFLLHQGLGGGGIASLRHDPQGKAMAQILMDMPVDVPAAWLEQDGLLAGWNEQGETQGAGK